MGKWGGWRRRSRRGGSGFRRVSLFTLPFCPAPRRGGNEFQPLPPFALPFRLLAGFKGNGFRRVSLFALPFCPAPRRGGSEFQRLPPFTLPFRLLTGFKGNGFRLVSPIYVALTPTPLKTKFFAKPIVTPPLVWYNTGYHRIVIQGIIVCFQACLHAWGTSFETLVQSTGMEI